MSYVVLARKWRPKKFSALVGQEPIVQTLENAISLNRVPHALVFTGTRGVGKTTMARLLAMALNCEWGPSTDLDREESIICKEIAAGTSVDVREIDGASNTSVDDIRDLRENIQYKPLKSRYKIYIIDEVHMLSTSAFNALLKTLEEPPPNVIFIFATTEPQKIPETILSRCQRFDFRQISDEQIAKHLRMIVDDEKIQISDVSLSLVARQADGSLRDALSLLDQVIAFRGSESAKISDDDVVSILGLTDRTLIQETLEAMVQYDSKKILNVLSEVLSKGFDPKSYLLEVWGRVRDFLVLKAGGKETLVRATGPEREQLKTWAHALSEEELERWFDLLRGALSGLSRTEFPRYLLEITFLKLTRKKARVPAGELIQRLESLEKRLSKSTTVAKNTEASQLSNPISEVVESSASWFTLLEAVKKEKPAFAAILLQAIQADFIGDAIHLLFEEGSFYISRAQEKDFQSYLLKTARELFGKEFMLKIQTHKPSSTPKESKASQDREREREALENSSVRQAVSLFQARVEEVKPLK